MVVASSGGIDDCRASCGCSLAYCSIGRERESAAFAVWCAVGALCGAGAAKTFGIEVPIQLAREHNDPQGSWLEGVRVGGLSSSPSMQGAASGGGGSRRYLSGELAKGRGDAVVWEVVCREAVLPRSSPLRRVCRVGFGKR
jgi:hypothetical protein